MKYHGGFSFDATEHISISDNREASAPVEQLLIHQNCVGQSATVSPSTSCEKRWRNFSCRAGKSEIGIMVVM